MTDGPGLITGRFVQVFVPGCAVCVKRMCAVVRFVDVCFLLHIRKLSATRGVRSMQLVLFLSSSQKARDEPKRATEFS